SSFVIVAVAVVTASDAFDGDDSTRANDSLDSGTASPISETVIDFERSPGANDSVPLAARKSDGAFAVPFRVEYATVTVRVLGRASVTTNVTGVSVPVPSATCTLATANAGGESVSARWYAAYTSSRP